VTAKNKYQKINRETGEEMKGTLLQNTFGMKHLNDKTKVVLLRFRPSIRNTEKMLTMAPKLKHIWMSSSENLRKTSPKTIAMIRNKGIELEYIGNRPVKILRYIGDAKEIEILERE